MATHIGVTSSHEKRMDLSPLQKETNSKTQGYFMFSKRLFLKWFGMASTILLALAAVSPDTLNAPLNWRPWVFLSSIFWVFAFCTGFFSL
jgi:hypothetical protein